MTTRLARLTKRSEFLRAAREGRRFAVSTCVLQICPHPGNEGGAAYLGFTVTKKLGGAVVRNRIKRRLREAARAVFPLHAVEGNDYVIIGRSKAERCDFSDMLRDMEFALSHLHKPSRNLRKQA